MKRLMMVLRMWPYVLLSILVALLVLSGWFGYHVYCGRIR